MVVKLIKILALFLLQVPEDWLLFADRTRLATYQRKSS